MTTLNLCIKTPNLFSESIESKDEFTSSVDVIDYYDDDTDKQDFHLYSSLDSDTFSSCTLSPEINKPETLKNNQRMLYEDSLFEERPLRTKS